MTQVRAALALVEGVETGERVAERIEALVAAVLDTPAVRLALAVREAGPFRVRRALKLAEAVLEASEAPGTEARDIG